MVRLLIRNGPCGMEEFFKIFSTSSKIEVFMACYERQSASFQELREALQGSMDESTLSKRLTEFINIGILEKLVFAEDSRTTYRVTQKAADVIPVFDSIKTFHRRWFPDGESDVIEAVSDSKRLLGSRWNSRIIWLLFVLRSVRFNELKNSIEGVSFKMLTQQLRALEVEQVICREDFHENPPHIEYSLTDKGSDLYTIILLVAQWNRRYGHDNGVAGTHDLMI